MNALQTAVALARTFEGLRLSPYLCPAGVPSIGYGTTRYEDGTAVTLTDPPITRERALALLQRDVERALAAALRLCPGIDTAGRAAALADFTYNLGAGRLAGSTLRRCVNAQDWPGVAIQLRRWVYGGGRRLAGLAARREAEAALVTA